MRFFVRVTTAGLLVLGAVAALAGGGAVSIAGAVVLLDVLTNPEEVSLPPKVTPGDAWGFAVAKLKEAVISRADS